MKITMTYLFDFIVDSRKEEPNLSNIAVVINILV